MSSTTWFVDVVRCTREEYNAIGKAVTEEIAFSALGGPAAKLLGKAVTTLARPVANFLKPRVKKLTDGARKLVDDLFSAGRRSNALELTTNLDKARRFFGDGSKTPEDVQKLIDSAVDAGWELGTMRSGRSKGKGLVLRERNAAGTDYTGRSIQWHPGGGHHGPHPYWKVSSGELGHVRFGPQFE